MLDESYCLDSSIVIDWLRGDQELDAKIQEAQEHGNIFMTVLTLCELYKGAYLARTKERALVIIKDLVENIGILDLSYEACEEFGKEYAFLDKIGKRTQEPDLMIASIAKVKNFIVVTRNKKHFENVDVRVEVW